MAKKGHSAYFVLISMTFLLSVNCFYADSAYADQAISALSAVKKGVQHFDALISKGELDPSWRDDIASIGIALRNIKGYTEYVVSFTAKSGQKGPVAVYLNMSGQYTGSSLKP
jgi:hypothetical protein